MGEAQVKWFVDSVRESDAKWKFVVSSSAWNPSLKKINESWVFSLKEREYVKNQLETIQRMNRKKGLDDKIFFITGDLHSGGALNFKPSNKFSLVEINVPHNSYGGYPITCSKQDCSGSWFWFNPGRYDFVKRYPNGSIQDLSITNSGYVIFEVYDNPKDYVNIKFITTQTYFEKNSSWKYRKGEGELVGNHRK